MKLKALFVAGAVCLANAVTTSAQTVYSANTVGFVNKTIPSGFSLISNPVIAADNTIPTLLSDVAVNNMQVFKFDAQAGTFSAFSYFFGWSQGADTTELVPGEGFFIFNPGDPVMITFSGEVAQGDASNRSIGQGFSIISSVVAQGGLLASELGFPVENNDQVFLWDADGQQYDPRSYFFGWGAAGEPSVEVADAFFVNKANASAWDRNFDPNAQ